MLMTSSWRTAFPSLEGISDSVSELLDKRSRQITLQKEALTFGPGSPAENLLLLLSGTVRVQQLSEDGREIVLYRVLSGESCVLTTACLLAFEDYSAEGIAETEIEAIMIQRDVFDELMAISNGFRAFVFEAYSKRITDLFLVIEEIAFKRMDVRVAQKLLELQDARFVLRHIHQQLATELGTARDAISRQLKEFERRGWVRLSRGEIELRDVAAIERLADAS
jgi:CRP/FNR family transcriptional regulator